MSKLLLPLQDTETVHVKHCDFGFGNMKLLELMILIIFYIWLYLSDRVD